MFSLCAFLFGYGQTILFEGDISIIGIDTPSEDFVFVTFVDLDAGTEIYFTDEEADGDNTIGAGEGTILYTVPVGGVLAGTAISYSVNTSNFNVTADGDIQLADSGDGLIAYQGTSVGNVTTFLHAVAKDASVMGTFPNGFSNYVLLNSDDGKYFGVRDGKTAGEFAVEVNKIANWVTSASGVSPFNLTNFTLNAELVNNCSELIISEYMEGSSFNKYIEIYNPTNAQILLTNNYSIQIFYNGSNSSSTIDLVGSIEPYGVFILSHSSAAIGVVESQSTNSLKFNGNDAVALANATSIIDVVGVIGDPTNFGEDKGFKRKLVVKEPSVLFDELEWDELSVDDFSNLGSYFGDCGYVCSNSKTSIWNGMAWSNGMPNKYTTAIVNQSYNTSSNTSFNACSLLVEENAILTIANSTFIEVQNNVEIKGDLIVETAAAFLQTNNLASFQILDNGTASVQKTAAPINAWYEYTYWSSPVTSAIIGNTLVNAAESRRFWFKAQNWLDAFAENNNNNAAVSGQDNVDDNGDDWQYVKATDLMIPGVGYAATYTPNKFTHAGQQYECVFFGAFNNGVITVPAYRNDTEKNDVNWNFIGNPYPSAIDVDAFFSENVYNSISNPSGVLDGAIYLWSQNTPPSNTANGNDQYNFSQSDYAVINGTGSISAGGDSQIPERFIPSCQGFFMSFSNNAQAVSTASAGIYKGNVIFNNAMRVQQHNNQFFKLDKNSKEIENTNRLWLNLTAEGGLFSQALVGYVDGATNELDTPFYDTVRNSSSKLYASIYSTVEGSESKLAIQGKSKEKLNVNEEFVLGFDTSIEQPITYELSIAKIEGDFLTALTVYVEDQVTGKSHNLSESSYFFTSEVGTFNKRFKIRFFKEEVLGIEDEVPLNLLSISIIENEKLEFSTLENVYMEHIQIVDLLGRKLIDFEGETNEKIVDLAALASSIYFVRVQLSNHKMIQKKLLKK
ncbi:lamin tail domain-containing protein [Lutibacter holmesii]|uniref:Lamin tail domain-containing protein n=1 Tax=Lutibacter holmesii TaxID=1137985 RepID=A0ABW3WMA8_9FLAO